MANVSKLLFIILFADDTNLFLNGKSVLNTIQEMNTELEKIVNWLTVNQLSLNINKTSYIIFSIKKSTLVNASLSINGKAIKQIEYVKFLGVILDKNMSWSQHIHYIRGKISKGIGILCRARKIFKTETLLTLYHSFIYPYLTYCVEVWGGANKCYISSIVKLQKSAVRIITSSS